MASGVIPQISRDHGAVRRRRGLLAGDDRLHLHGEGQLLHVRDRPRRGEDRDARGGDARGAGRRAHPHQQVRRRRPRLRERRRGAAASCAASSTSCRSNNREKAPVRPHHDPADRDRRLARHAGARQPEQALRHEGADPARSSTTATSSSCSPSIAGNIVIGFGRMDGADRRHRRQPAAGAGRLPRHQRARSRRRASCASATPSTSRS